MKLKEGTSEIARKQKEMRGTMKKTMKEEPRKSYSKLLFFIIFKSLNCYCSATIALVDTDDTWL